jgi:pimeloyl-ACP methyl ester carboxylesterase
MSTHSPKRTLAVVATAIIVATLGALNIWTRVLTARAERDFPPLGRFVEVDGARVHFIEKGSGRPVVFIHGIYGAAQDFATTLLDEASTRCRAIAIDRPGHGWSDRGSGVGSPAEQARVLHEALAQMGVERPIVVGFSWGAAVATAYALRFPDETAGVMTINGALYEWEGDIGVFDTLAGVPLVGDLLLNTVAMPSGLALANGRATNAFAPALLSPLFARAPIPLELRPGNLAANAQDMRVIKASLRAQSPHYRELKPPLAIVAGLGDRVASPQFHSYRIHREVAGSTLFPIEGGGHQVLYSHPREVLAALDALLEQIARRP